MEALQAFKKRFGPDSQSWIRQSIGYCCLNGSIYFDQHSSLALRNQQNMFIKESMQTFFRHGVTQVIVFCHQPLLHTLSGAVVQPEKSHEVIDILSDFPYFPIHIISGHDHRYHQCWLYVWQ